MKFKAIVSVCLLTAFLLGGCGSKKKAATDHQKVEKSYKEFKEKNDF